MIRTKTIILECSYCHTMTHLNEFKGGCPNCGETIVEARYAMDEIDFKVWASDLRNRPPDLWRYHEILPVYNTENIISLGEGGTPLIKSRALAASLGLKNLYLKDERQGPTGSFKDRQASVAISALVEMGIDEVVVASTGNVAIAYAAYGARAGIKVWAFFPRLTPNDKMREAALYGAEVIKTTGNYDQTKILAAQFARSKGVFLDKGIKSVAAIEAMKTMSYEIAEQLGRYLEGNKRWRVPDWFLQGVSGGMGPIGVGKGFKEMYDAGLTDKMPAFGVIQSTGCAPMVEAYNRGQRVATPIEKSKTIIATLATGDPGRAYELLYDYVGENGGHFISATDEEAFQAIRLLARTDGVSVEPATGVTFAGLFKLVQQGIIKPDDVVVVNVSGHTLPVEKTILGEQWQKLVDLSDTQESIALPPEKSLVDAIDTLDGQNKQIVVIEDNEAAARLMSRILESRDDCEVHLAHNGKAGMDLIRQISPDMVITDLMMPDVDGFQVIEQMKADPQLAHIPIIVVTAKELTVKEHAQIDGKIDMLLQKGSFLDDSFVQNLIEKLR
ncbi:MAG: threonine synthase [Phototrophicales bacterium]|nr:threonine synthase [Phototrophicales bacterium]